MISIIAKSMNRSERYRYILDYFRLHVGESTTELQFSSPFQLLCATLLSAQCTDKRVNQITPALFQTYPSAKEMAAAEEEDILFYIKSVSYPNAKAKHLLAMANMIHYEFHDEIPNTLEELTRLPGVGRKTANVLLAVWYGQPAMPVDTHVYRVSHRLGLVPSSANTPQKVENCLVKSIPSDDVAHAQHWLLLHGRYICTSQKPKCVSCPFDNICPKLLDNSRL